MKKDHQGNQIQLRSQVNEGCNIWINFYMIEL